MESLSSKLLCFPFKSRLLPIAYQSKFLRSFVSNKLKALIKYHGTTSISPSSIKKSVAPTPNQHDKQFSRKELLSVNIDGPKSPSNSLNCKTVQFLCTKSGMSYKIEALPDSYTEVGKGPQWDPVSQNLYYVDVDTGKLLRYDYKQNKVYKCKLEGENLVAFIVPIEGNATEFAVGCLRRAVIVNWDGISETCKVARTLFEVQPGEKFKNNRFNDGKCDPCGRLIAGTMKFGGDEFKERLGELYSYSKGGQVKVIKTDVGISNGVAFDVKAKKLYYVDTADFEVKAFDYDFETGVATNCNVIRDFRKPDPKDNLFPDGMTIDSDGNIYVTTFNGYTIYKIEPSTGKVLLEIKFPCMRITAAAFGGPNLDILYVTTSSRGGEPAPAGCTFKVTGLGAKGLPIAKLQI